MWVGEERKINSELGKRSLHIELISSIFQDEEGQRNCWRRPKYSLLSFSSYK
jgi:hypothetical protein